jgi:hypothetical protein
MPVLSKNVILFNSGEVNMLYEFNPTTPILEENTDEPANVRTTEARVRVQIPSEYHQEPVISFLASEYRLQVNILAALLTGNAKESGWFDLLSIFLT